MVCDSLFCERSVLKKALYVEINCLSEKSGKMVWWENQKLFPHQTGLLVLAFESSYYGNCAEHGETRTKI